MLEFLKWERVALALLAFTVVLTFVLVMESFSVTHEQGKIRLRSRPVQAKLATVPPDQACWAREDFSLVQRCRLCSAYDTVSRTKSCAPDSTHYEAVNCSHSGIAYRPCTLRQSQALAYFCHWLAYLVAGLAFWAMANRRATLLEKQLHNRIRGQLSTTPSASAVRGFPAVGALGVGRNSQAH